MNQWRRFLVYNAVFLVALMGITYGILAIKTIYEYTKSLIRVHVGNVLNSACQSLLDASYHK